MRQKSNKSYQIVQISFCLICLDLKDFFDERSELNSITREETSLETHKLKNSRTKKLTIALQEANKKVAGVSQRRRLKGK